MIYRCPECGWQGTEEQMEADYVGGEEGESWSNWICPECQMWWRLEDYEVVKTTVGDRRGVATRRKGEQ